MDRLEVLTDMGYYDGQQVKACLEAGITPYIPKPNTSANTQLGLFGKDDFRYDPVNDCYRCPAGERLTFRFPWPVRQGRQSIEEGRERRTYATSACAHCALPGLRLGQANPNAPVAPKAAASPAGPKRICWRTCSAGCGPAPRR